MKKFIATLTALLTLTVTANAMSYAQAREQALFLTDKMAYELNFTEEQYDAAYEINLDYLMSVNTYDDLYGDYWRMRNLDLSYILLDWQYRAYCAASYFYRPLYWTSGVWHFAIYSRYPRRNYFYFGRPNIYVTYRGGHSWNHNGGHSCYKGRTFNHGSISSGHGMRDRFDRGDFNKGNRGGLQNRNNGSVVNGNNKGTNSNRNNRNGSFSGNRNNGGTGSSSQSTSGNRANTGNNATNSSGRYSWNRSILGQDRGNTRTNRESSTRTTARQSTSTSSSSFGGSRRTSGSSTTKTPSSTFTPSSNRAAGVFGRSSQSRSSSSSRSTVSSGGRSFNSSNKSSVKSSGSRNSGGGSSHGGHFGGRR